MQRVRISLPYFKEMGWEPVVICVDEKLVEGYLDPLLLQTIPGDIEIHKVKAFPVKVTRKLGLGSLSLRSLWYFRKKGNQLMNQRKFDLIYFSTTMFHVCSLGPYWKKKFNIPFIIDFQDPWRSDFYLDKPKAERPPKFFIAYNIDKFLESRTVPAANGFISVSASYETMLKDRYSELKDKKFRIIPFGASAYDFTVMEKHIHGSEIKLHHDKINIVYIGRGGHDMRTALSIVFQAFKKGLGLHPHVFNKAHFYFIGTSYATAGHGEKTVIPVAEKFGLGKYVTEITDRIPYFETLYLLKKAGILFIPGSIDTSYSASKVYPYVLACRPLLAVFNNNSNVVKVLNELQYGEVVTFDNAVANEKFVDECFEKLYKLLIGGGQNNVVDSRFFEPFTAKHKTMEQVEFFNEIIAFV